MTKKVTASTLFSTIPVAPVCLQASELLGSGVISTSILTTLIDSVAASNLNFTLAAATHGTVKEIAVKTLTPTYTATIAVTGGKGFTTISFSNTGQSVYLKNLNGDWYVISYRGATIA